MTVTAEDLRSGKLSRLHRKKNEIVAVFIFPIGCILLPQTDFTFIRTRVAAPSPRASLGRRTVCGRTEQRRPPVSKRYETN